MSAFHGEQTSAQGIHTLTAWEHVDIAARNAGTYAAGDVGKVSRVGTGGGPFTFYILKDAVGPITDANWDDVGTSTGSTVAPLTGRLYVDRTYAGPAASDGSIAAPFTTIQDAVNACNLGGAATPAEEEAQSWLVVIAGGYYDEALALPEKRSIWLKGGAGVYLSDGISNQPVTIPGTVLPSSNAPYTYTFENIIFSDTVTVTSGVALTYHLSFRSCVFFDPAGTAVGPAVDGTGWVGGSALRVYAEKSVLRAFDGNYAIQLVGDTQNTAVGMDECQLEGGITCAGYGRMRSCQFGNGPSGTCDFDFNAAGIGLTAVTLSNVERPVGVFDSQFAGSTQFNDASATPNTNLYVDNVSDKSFSDAGGTFGANTNATHPLWNASAGGPPTGAAGGDLGSNYPNPAVTAVHSGANQLAIANGLAGDEVLVVNGAGTSITGSALTNFGDLSGPAGAADTALAVFDSTTGKLIKDVATTTLEDTTGPKLKLAAAAIAGHNAQIILDAGTLADKSQITLLRGGVTDWVFGVTASDEFHWADASGTVRLKLDQTGALTFNEAYTFPTTDGGVAGEVLTTDGGGTVTWAAPAGGGTVTSTAATTVATQLALMTTDTNIYNAPEATLVGGDFALDASSLGVGHTASLTLKSGHSTDPSILMFEDASTARWAVETINPATSGNLRFKELGTNLTVMSVSTTGALTLGDHAGGHEFTLPDADGTINQVLQTNGAGAVSWGSVAGGGTVTSSAAGTTATQLAVMASDTDIYNAPEVTLVEAGLALDASALGVNHDASVTLASGTTADDAVINFKQASTAKFTVGITDVATTPVGELLFWSGVGTQLMSLSDTAHLTIAPGVNQYTLPSARGAALEVLQTDAVGNVSWAAVAGTGDVSGPGAAVVDDALVRWDTTTGTLVKDSYAVLTDAQLTLTGVAAADAASLTLTAGTTADATLNIDAGSATNRGTIAFKQAGTDVMSLGVAASATSLGLLDSGSVQRFAFSQTGVLTINPAAADFFAFPSGDGAASQVLQTDGAGAVTWATIAGTGDVVGPAGATDTALARFDTNTGKLLQNSEATLTDLATDNKVVLTLDGGGAGDAGLTLTTGATPGHDATVTLDHGGAAADTALLKFQSNSTLLCQLGLLGDGVTALPGITLQDDAGNTNLTVTYEAGAPVAGLHTTVATVDASGYVGGSIASLVVDGGPAGGPGLETHATLEFKQAGVAGFHFLSRMGGMHTTPTLMLRSGFGDDVLQLDATAAGAPTICINGSDLGGDHWFLPTVDGTAGQVLTTDGTHNAGGAAWATPAGSNVEILKADFSYADHGGTVTVIPDLAEGDVVLQVWVRYTIAFNNGVDQVEVGNTGSVDAYFGMSDTAPHHTASGFSTEPVDLVTVGPSPADVIVTITPGIGLPSTTGTGFVCVLVHRA